MTVAAVAPRRDDTDAVDCRVGVGSLSGSGHDTERLQLGEHQR